MEGTILLFQMCKDGREIFENNCRVLLEDEWHSGHLVDSLTVDNIMVSIRMVK